MAEIWYVRTENLAQVHSLFFNLDLRFHFTVQMHLTVRLHARNKIYFWEISFLNLAQQTSSKFYLEISPLLSSQSEIWHVMQHRSFSQQRERNPLKKQFLCGFILVSNEETRLALLPWVSKPPRYFWYHVKCHGRFISSFCRNHEYFSW